MTKKLIQPGNTKLKGMYMFNLPASKEVCNRICKGCYAIKEQVRFPAALAARTERYNASLEDSFPATVTKELGRLRKRPQYFRIHASGDFYAQDYINKWYSIASANPDITFYAYTKRMKDFDFSQLSNLSNVMLIDSLHFKKLNYGPEEKAPDGAFICPDHKNETQCGVTCTYCMTKEGAHTNGVFFIQH